jgi:anti-sigma regulatory factor (Ser/Thr protein kinase)
MYAQGIGQLDELSIPSVLVGEPQLRLEPEPMSASAARAFVRRHVDAADVDLRDSAELLASELVTNGVLHARSAMTLGIVARKTCVLIAVSDNSDAVPAERQPSLSAEGGRGIALVAMIARQWGIAQQDSGKIIWCLIDSEPTGAP